jgi:general secretion pathway protein D
MKIRNPLIVLALWIAAFVLTAALPARSDDTAYNGGPDSGDTSQAVLDEIDVRDVPLRDALSLIGSLSNINLAATDDASKTNVTLHLHNVTPYQAVEVLCQTHGLYFRRPGDEGVGIVTTLKEFQDGLTVFRQENTQVFTLLYPNALDLAVAIHDLYGDRVHLSIGKEGVYDDASELSRRLSVFDQLDQRGQSLSLFSSGGSGSSGGGGFGGNGSTSNTSGVTSSGSGLEGSFNQSANQPTQQPGTELQNLTPEQVARLSNQVYQQGAGVGVNLQTLSGLGHNYAPIYVSVINRNNQVIVRTSDPTVLDEIAELKKKIDVPTPQVLLEVKVLSVELTDGMNSIFDYQFTPSGNQSLAFSTGSNELAGSPFALNPTSLIYQYVSDNFQARIQLLETHNKVTELATPMLLVANNEVSRIFVGQEQPIVQNISSQTTATQGVITSSPQTTFNFEPVGTTLLITPNINADRTVTLRMVEEQSSIITDGATIPIVGSNGSVTNQPVDVVSATTLTGTLVAKDGLSLALGGLIDESVQNQNEQVPILGDLPYLGFLFRRQSIGRTRNEVVVVIRPYILSTPSEAQDVSKRLTDATSLHPIAPDLYPAQGRPIGTMNTYLPWEAARPSPPRNKLEAIFHFYTVLPED